MKGIAIAGFKPNLIIGPFFSKNLQDTEKLYLLYTTNKGSMSTFSTVKETLRKLNIEVVPLKVQNIFDFFEVFFSILHIRNDINWVNTTSGPGIAIGAVVVSLWDRNIDLVYFHEARENIPGTTDVINVGHLHRFLENPFHLILLNCFKDREKIDIEKLSSLTGKSQSTVSRALTSLKNLGYISNIGVGRGSSKKEFFLTDKGLEILHRYSES